MFPICVLIKLSAVEPFFRGHPDKRPPLLERLLDNVNININVLMSTPDNRTPLLKGHFSDAKGWPHKRGPTIVILATPTSVYYMY